ncbi:MAG: pyrimidine dimer DNA glycosylase/endonuclease V [Candidatus Diapherotrites archaeon]|nr:pyrimidine dimer DNA glycosylase/endonuclease V [Candidatus Diapherotrites archaeon]
MRLWSISPKYLDSKGLVALWREGLLAKKVLLGKTNGYKNHPQLFRFLRYRRPLDAINSYLTYVFEEAKKRDYRFRKDKITAMEMRSIIPVKKGQIEYEFKHLKNKLLVRDKSAYEKCLLVRKIEPNPVFKIVHGGIEPWEKIA